jgi:hypothetical protein
MLTSHFLKYVGRVSDIFLIVTIMTYLIFIVMVRDQFDTMQLVIFFGLGFIAIALLGRALFKKLCSNKSE